MKKEMIKNNLATLFIKLALTISYCCVFIFAQQDGEAKPVFNGWLMVFLITAVLAGIAWVAMNRKTRQIGLNGDQILLDLSDKLQRGEISQDEFESRKRDLDL